MGPGPPQILVSRLPDLSCLPYLQVRREAAFAYRFSANPMPSLSWTFVPSCLRPPQREPSASLTALPDPVRPARTGAWIGIRSRYCHTVVPGIFPPSRRHASGSATDVVAKQTTTCLATVCTTLRSRYAGMKASGLLSTIEGSCLFGVPRENDRQFHCCSREKAGDKHRSYHGDSGIIRAPGTNQPHHTAGSDARHR